MRSFFSSLVKRDVSENHSDRSKRSKSWKSGGRNPFAGGASLIIRGNARNHPVCGQGSVGQGGRHGNGRSSGQRGGVRGGGTRGWVDFFITAAIIAPSDRASLLLLLLLLLPLPHYVLGRKGIFLF